MARPLFGRRTTTGSSGTEPDYWLSYSDLMAGLLMVFALMLMAALFQQGTRECQLVVYEATADTIKKLLDTRQRVVGNLRERFDGDSLNDSMRVTVDSAGTVHFAGSLLFEQASAEVSQDGRRELASFARDYFPLLLEDQDFREQLNRIVVEGHTNDDGTYELNLGLSHARSMAVMQVLLEEAGTYEDDLKEFVTANGRSFADLKLLPDGRVDRVGSRRIEIRFQMDDETLAQRVLELGAILIDPQCEQTP